MNEQINNSEPRELIILKGAVENAREAFITIDGGHRILLFNRTAEKMFGYKREEVIGSDLCVILNQELHERHPQAVLRYLDTRESRVIGRETELIAKRRNGESFPASISFSVAEIDGELFFTAIIRDMTETRQLQRQVAQGERLALLGQVVAEISHEIRNPLVLIGGWARRLHRNAPDEHTRLRLAAIIQEVQRLENLLTELRHLYVPRKHTAEQINIRELIEEAYRLVKTGCEEKEVLLVVETEDPAPLIMGDREKLIQVLLNLLKNGLEAVAPGGRLALGSQTGRGVVRITISDTGPGIPARYRDRVFTPFFTTKRQGTGLGLCVTKRIIEDHPGSSLSLESVEGSGTSVHLLFPVFKMEVRGS